MAEFGCGSGIVRKGSERQPAQECQGVSVTSRDVTVSIVSHEHEDEIPHLLSDLARFAAHDINEVIVTLNIPEQALSEFIESTIWPFSVRIIRNIEPCGYGANHNKAFAGCKTKYYCIVNPDVRLSENPFPSLVNSLAQNRAACTYPRQSNGSGEPQDLAREVPTPWALVRRYLVPRRFKQEQPKHWINGAFMLYPSALFKALGGFDESYFMYCEDVEICLRFQLRGFRLVSPADVSIQHVAQHASRRRMQHLMWHIESLFRLWRSSTYREFLRLRARPDPH